MEFQPFGSLTRQVYRPIGRPGCLENLRLFEQLRDDLSVSCIVLAVIVDEALSFAVDNAPAAQPELARLFFGLFDRSVERLDVILSALEAHGRVCGTLPNAAPLHPDHFRSTRARQLARMNRFHARLPLPRDSFFWLKLAAITTASARLRLQERRTTLAKCRRAQAVRCAPSVTSLEILNTITNTCLQKPRLPSIVLLCAARQPGGPVSLALAHVRRNAPRRVTSGWTPAPFPDTIGASSSGSRPAGTRGSPKQPVAGWNAGTSSGTSSWSGHRIPSLRTRPDGTGGPNETNRTRGIFRSRSDPTGSGRRCCCFRAHLSTAQPSRICPVPENGRQHGGCRGFDAGSVLAAIPQDRNFPRRIGVFDVAASAVGQCRPDAFTQEDPGRDFA